MDAYKKYVVILDDSSFKINYYNSNGNEVKKFSLSNLIKLKPIKANNIENEKSLSKAFSTIIKYRYKSLLNGETKNQLEERIMKINNSLTANISSKHTKEINKSLGKIESTDKLKVELSADLTFQKLMNNLVKYEYVEQNHRIPENQFGLGYTNLMMIIADLIDYMERYPEQSFNSKLNLISIEEPETLF